MLFTTGLALAIGAVIGLITGGRWQHVADHQVTAWWLVIIGLALLVAMDHLALGGAGTALVLLGDAALLVFCAMNPQLIGLGIVAVGVAANALVIGMNGGMPVRPSAVVAAQLASPLTEPRLGYGHRHHRQRPGDRLTFLADTIPIPELHQVVSFGDLILAVGVADAAAHLTHASRRRMTARHS